MSRPDPYRQNIWDSFPHISHVRAPVNTRDELNACGATAANERPAAPAAGTEAAVITILVAMALTACAEEPKPTVHDENCHIGIYGPRLSRKSDPPCDQVLRDEEPRR